MNLSVEDELAEVCHVSTLCQQKEQEGGVCVLGQAPVRAVPAVNTHTHTHTHMHTHTHTHAHAHRRTRTHTHTHARTHAVC